MNNIYSDYKKSVIADFNKSYKRDIKRGKELDEEVNNMKAKLTAVQVSEILARPDLSPSVLAKKYGVAEAAIYYHRKKAKGVDPNNSRRAKRIVKKAATDLPITETVKNKTIPEKVSDIEPLPKAEPLEMLLSETQSFEAHLFEMAAVHNKKITITIEIN